MKKTKVYWLKVLLEEEEYFWIELLTEWKYSVWMNSLLSMMFDRLIAWFRFYYLMPISFHIEYVFLIMGYIYGRIYFTFYIYMVIMNIL